MKSIMIDLETLATAPEAAVISIGVCAFDLDKGVTASDGWAIAPSDWHGTIDPKTVKWWMEQNEAAREYSFGGKISAVNAGLALMQFIRTNGGGDRTDECWANDPDFDVVILRKWWERTGKEAGYKLGPFPISYKAPRSCRTMYAEARRLDLNTDNAYGMGTVAHNPIDDACNQARAMIAIRNQLMKAGPICDSPFIPPTPRSLGR